ncbi:hypothetical protein LIER_37261 [Lithospermum erythrorhizon]|uniref:Uncharacterized protein n=1 Tax=Lithospermum erythrorhizon TaxID=34254 RepID=A0AAV3PKR0_LITER
MKPPSNPNPYSYCLGPEMRRRKLRLLLQSLNKSADIPSAATPNILRRVTVFSIRRASETSFISCTPDAGPHFGFIKKCRDVIYGKALNKTCNLFGRPKGLSIRFEVPLVP